MSEVRYNNITGAVGVGGMSSSASVITFAAAPAFPTVSSSDYAKLTLLDTYEVMYLSPYTSGSVAGVVLRGQEGTTAVAHGPGAQFVHGPTAADFSSAATSGNRSATITIAASNSTAADKAAADYVCTGASVSGGDEVTFAAALAALPGHGGNVYLCDGTYWRSAPIAIDQSNVLIQGSGYGSCLISPAANATGYADMIVGSTNAASQPQNVVIQDIQFYDGSSGTSPYGSYSNHGLVYRGNNGAMNRVRSQRVNLDGFRWEGFKTFGTPTTLAASISTASASITLNSTTNASVGAFGQIGTASDFSGATNPEWVRITNISGSVAAVSRGYGGTTAASGSGLAFTPFTPTLTFDLLGFDCYSVFSNRTGFYIDPWIDNSVMFKCEVNGGTSTGSGPTVNGIYCTGDEVHFTECHPYFCTTSGLYVDGHNQPTARKFTLIGGEYESNGVQGINVYNADDASISDASLYSNTGTHITISSSKAMRVSGRAATAPSSPNQHIYVGNSTGIHINGYVTDAGGSGAGIKFDAGTTLSSIRNCQLTGFTTTGGNAVSVILNNSNQNAVESNTVDACMFETSSSNYNRFRFNTLYSVGAGSGFGTGGSGTPVPNNGPASIFTSASVSPSGTVITQNYGNQASGCGFITEHTGAASIPSGQTSQTGILHGLGTGAYIADASGSAGSASVTSASNAFPNQGAASVPTAPNNYTGAPIPVTGTNIPAGTYIINAASGGGTIQLNQNPSGTVSGVTIWTNPITPSAVNMNFGFNTSGIVAAGAYAFWPSSITNTSFQFNCYPSAGSLGAGWNWKHSYI